jgi:hypothetical protein
MDKWVEISLAPSQQQLENSSNQKTKPPHNQKMGWDNSANTHPHKERNTNY